MCVVWWEGGGEEGHRGAQRAAVRVVQPARVWRVRGRRGWVRVQGCMYGTGGSQQVRWHIQGRLRRRSVGSGTPP